MNELKTYKERKLAEFDEIFGDRFDNITLYKPYQIQPDHSQEEFSGKTATQWLKQFISDLIDEMENNAFLKDIVKQTRIDTLEQVLMSEEYIGILNNDKLLAELYNSTIKNKAKELWGIELNK